MQHFECFQKGQHADIRQLLQLTAVIPLHLLNEMKGFFDNFVVFLCGIVHDAPLRQSFYMGEDAYMSREKLNEIDKNFLNV